MESEWRTDINPGYRTKILHIGPHTVEINRPILDEKEQARREQVVCDALWAFGKTMERSVNHG